jgi:ACS family hexuronate transporter-like MFS transporter
MLYLTEDLGVSVILAGTMLAILQSSNIVMRIGWGVISDAIGKGKRKPVLYVTSASTFAVLVVVALLPAGTPLWALVLVALAIGGTATSWVSVHSVLLAELSEPGKVGMTIGYASTVSRTGIVVAPLVFGMLADGAGYRAAWLTLAGAILVGFAVLSLIHEKPREAVGGGQTAE